METDVFALSVALSASVSRGFAAESANDQEVDCPVAFQPNSSAKTTLTSPLTLFQTTTSNPVRSAVLNTAALSVENTLQCSRVAMAFKAAFVGIH